MKIISYNVNGIRAAIRKGFYDWLGENDFDVVCVQETKAHPEQVDQEPLAAMGYDAYWVSAEKKGYSGVATFTRKKPRNVEKGCGMDRYDKEGRILRLDFEDWSIMNCYFPSGTTGEERQTVKMDFLTDFQPYASKVRANHPQMIIVGDYNIAHSELDIHDPVRNKKTSGFRPEERSWMSGWFADGWVDSYRSQHPDKVMYTWWSLRSAARTRNKGWRIDYQSVSENIKDKIMDADILNDVVHSDHCPILLDIDL